jgi:hypothetical protein
MTITVRLRSGSKRRAHRANHASGLGEAIVNGRDGEHAPDSGLSRDRHGTAGFDPYQTIRINSANFA